jgi:flagellar hook-length control protein FliK
MLAEAAVRSIDSFEKLTGPERLTFGGIFSRPGKGDRPDAPGDTSTGSVSTENVFERSMSIAGASDAAEVPAPSRAEAASQVAPAIIELEKFIGQEKNMDSLKMRLSPAELGSVEITLIRNDDGSMSAQLMTETESAQSSLSESLSQLRESLESAGIQVEAIEIGCKSFSSAGQGDGREGPRMQQNAGGNDPATAAETGSAAEETGDDNRLLDLQA